MKKLFCPALSVALLLSACGYKGDLYLPRDGDKARFGVIQTGLTLPSETEKLNTPVTEPKP